MSNERETYNDQFAENQWAHYLIRRIDLAKDNDAILARLNNTQIKKKPLKTVITYLKSSFAAKYPNAVEDLSVKKANITKNELFGQLIKFAEVTFPHSCLTCKTEYFPYTQNRSENEVTCFICNLPAHEGCVKEEHIAKDRGIVYICQNCLLEQGKTEATIPETADKPPQSSSPESDDVASEKSAKDKHSNKKNKDTRKEPVEPVKKKKYSKRKSDTHSKFSSSGPNSTESDSSDKEEKRKKYKNICKLYQTGTCPFGRSGRECPKQHPPHCRRWCSYGSDKWGCQWGDECWFFHPELCEHSVKIKKCLNLDCTKIHLKGTQRYAQRANEEDFNQYPNNSFRQPDFNRKTQDNFRNSGNRYNSYKPSYGNSNPTRFNQNPYNQTNNRRENLQESGNSNKAYQEIKPFLDQQLGAMLKELKKSIADQLQSLPNQPVQQPSTQAQQIQAQHQTYQQQVAMPQTVAEIQPVNQPYQPYYANQMW